MAVIEHNEEIEQITPRKKGRGCFSCAVVFALALIFVFFWFVWSLAATGLVEVPIMTALAFDKPAPDHVVKPSLVSPEDWLQNQVLSQATNRVLAGKPIDGDLSLVVPESVMTSMLRASSSFFPGDKIPLEIKSGQIAVANDALEVFVPISETETALKISIIPFLSDGGIGLELKSVKVGSMKVPSLIVKYALNNIVNLGVDKANSSLENLVDITDISVADDGLAVEGSISKNALGF